MKESSVLQPPRNGRFEAVQIMAAKNAEDMAAREPNLPFVVAVWFAQVRIFQDGENERIIGGTATQPEWQAHKEVLATLISQGEFLARVFRERDLTGSGVTLADVEATLEGLYDKQRMFYGGMTEARRAEVLDEVFGAS